jgi:hypothetical protein
MRSVCLLLALGVSPAEGDTVDLFGAGIINVLATEFPSPPTRLVVYAHLHVEAPECGYTHQLRLECRAPDGAVILAMPLTPFTPQPDPQAPYRPIVHRVEVDVPDFSVPAAGDYGFYLLVDNIVLETVPLYVHPGSPNT